MINSICSLIQHDCYSYDIVSAYPTILGKQFYDFQDIDLENKKERNIFIGTQQIGNEALASFLLSSVDSLVKFYLVENDISDEDVIVTQRDGFILKQLLQNNDEFIDMKFREFIDFLILSPDRKKFIYCSDGKITVKGISHFYKSLDKIYQLFASLNFYSKTTLFEQLDQIKQALFSSVDKTMFAIPKGDNKYIISTFKGDIEVSDPDYVSIESIDKSRYYKHFFKDFLGAIYLESY